MSGMSKGGLFLLPPELLSGTWRSTCIVIVVVSTLGTRRRVYIPCSPWSHRNDCCHWVKRLFKTRCLTRPDLSNWVTPRKWSDIHTLFKKKQWKKNIQPLMRKRMFFEHNNPFFFFVLIFFFLSNKRRWCNADESHDVKKRRFIRTLGGRGISRPAAECSGSLRYVKFLSLSLYISTHLSNVTRYTH